MRKMCATGTLITITKLILNIYLSLIYNRYVDILLLDYRLTTTLYRP